MENIKAIKRKLGLKNRDLAKIFGYQSEYSYNGTSKKANTEHAIVMLYSLIKRSIYNDLKDKIQDLNDVIEIPPDKVIK